MNVVIVQGVLSSAPRVKDLASGTRLTNWEITTVAGGEKLSVPVTWFDMPAKLAGISQGDEVLVMGSVRRRYFGVGGSTASRTEVVAHKGGLAARKRDVERVLNAARDLVNAAAA